MEDLVDLIDGDEWVMVSNVKIASEPIDFRFAALSGLNSAEKNIQKNNGKKPNANRHKTKRFQSDENNRPDIDPVDSDTFDTEFQLRKGRG